MDWQPFDRADLAVHGGVAVARGKKDRTLWGRVEAKNWLRLHRSTYPGLRHHFWWLFWPIEVIVLVQLAQAAVVGEARRADDGGSSTDL
jgi:hypothetical protein